MADVCHSGDTQKQDSLQVVTTRTETPTDQEKSIKKRVTSNKILVRNVPFEATQKEVQELFRAFGGLKCVRLPKKLTGTGTHRGFGFVEFNSFHEAEVGFRRFDLYTFCTTLEPKCWQS